MLLSLTRLFDLYCPDKIWNLVICDWDGCAVDTLPIYGEMWKAAGATDFLSLVDHQTTTEILQDRLGATTAGKFYFDLEHKLGAADVKRLDGPPGASGPIYDLLRGHTIEPRVLAQLVWSNSIFRPCDLAREVFFQQPYRWGIPMKPKGLAMWKQLVTCLRLKTPFQSEAVLLMEDSVRNLAYGVALGFSGVYFSQANPKLLLFIAAPDPQAETKMDDSHEELMAMIQWAISRVEGADSLQFCQRQSNYGLEVDRHVDANTTEVFVYACLDVGARLRFKAASGQSVYPSLIEKGCSWFREDDIMYYGQSLNGEGFYRAPCPFRRALLPKEDFDKIVCCAACGVAYHFPTEATVYGVYCSDCDAAHVLELLSFREANPNAYK